MQKVIKIEKAGYVWYVDLAYIADDRAKHYAGRDSDTTYKAEYDFVMEDDYEGIDWFRNNMNWSDIPKDKKKLVTIPAAPDGPDDIDYVDDDEFTISDKEWPE